MLDKANLRFDIPVSNMTRAKTFYAERLGLSCTHENEFSVQYRHAGSYFVLTPSGSAGKAEHSLLTWLVDDIDQVKRRLEERGVIFEEYDFGSARTVNGIMNLDGDRIAWFRDSEGNLLAVAQVQ